MTQSCAERERDAVATVGEDRRLPVTLWDVVICFVAVSGIVLHCVARSCNKHFWTDEILTGVVLRGASIRGVLDSLLDTINAMPPLYFVLAWAWSWLFGVSPLALRILSSIFVAACWMITWSLLRPLYGRYVSAAATTFGLLCSGEVLRYNVEARCYSLYLALALGAAWLFVVASKPLNVRQRRWCAVGSILCHGGLVAVHYVGCFYSAGLIAAALACAALGVGSKGLRAYSIGVFGSIGAGVACLPFFLAQRSLGGQDSWLKRPGIYDLYELYVFDNSSVPFALLLLCAAALGLTVIGARAGRVFTSDVFGREYDWCGKTSECESATLPLAVVWCVFAAVPIVIWLESRVGARLFLPRYMLPSVFVWPAALAVLMERVLIAPSIGTSLFKVARGMCVSVCILLICWTVICVRATTVRMDGSMQTVARVSRVVRETGFRFVSANLHRVLPVKFADGDCRFLVLTTNGSHEGQNRAVRSIAASLERRYWPDLSWHAADLLAANRPLVMLAEDFSTLRELGVVGKDWREVKREGDVVIVERRSVAGGGT